MADARKLVKARGRNKAQMTRARNWLRVFDIQSHQIEEVEVRLESIQQAWDEFRVNQNPLEELSEEYEDDGEREAFEAEYYTASATAKALIARHSRPRTAVQEIREADNQNVHHHLQAIVEFPAIQKESYNGLRQLLDHTEKHVRALKKLGEPTDQWSTILVHLMTAKFDNATKREWEIKTAAREVATYTQFIKFTTDRCVMLETLQLDKSKSAKSSVVSGDTKSINANKKSVAAVASEAKSTECLTCSQGKHRIYQCPAFLNLTPQARNKEIKRLKLCFNCFKGGHSIEACGFGTCRLCHKKHNTLLHVTKAKDTESEGVSQSSAIEPKTTSTESQAASAGEFQECRAFLDPGAQLNFMTKELCERLELPQQKNYSPLRGIYNTRTSTLTDTHTTIRSRFNAFEAHLTFSVLPEIIGMIPLSEINKRHVKIPETIKLADPSFHTPGKIDVLLGTVIFWDLLCVGQVKLGRNQPVAQKTKLGWVIGGPLKVESPRKASTAAICLTSTTNTIEAQLERFWKIEEGVPHAEPSENDKICEDEFVRYHKRNAEERFEVRLPLRDSVERLGQSQEVAIKRLKSLERKFAKLPNLKQQYTKFIQEYEELGHMTRIMDPEQTKTTYFLPHHGVVRDDSLTTKLRVVFDASCPTSTGVSLNDILRVGPTIQQDLWSIVLRFRQHKVVITADIKQMYRQILIQNDQRNLQRIVWREDASESIREYRLNTVTYGTASAPFLAIRCLHQLAIENQDKYPETSDIIRNDFYVDDLLSGGEDVDTVRKLKNELTEILQSAGFQLHKWSTNEPTILNTSHLNTSEIKGLPKDDEIKTLGVCWNTTNDCLQYKTQAITKTQRVTKRSVLSTIAQVFDPLGLMGPTIICAKIILQQLWQLKIGWDESLPLPLHTMWVQYQNQVNEINSISIPRRIIGDEPQTIELHGFCDASEASYGACIYVRSTNPSGEIVSRLLCAKSRVAPLKSITLPRLELCGAVTLVKLGKMAQQALSIKFDHVQYWSDSTITLAWIAHRPGELQTFVANRVATIQRTAPEAQWTHVRSKDNPADIISRGATPQALKDSPLWWTGPAWLSSDRREWPSELHSNATDVPELKKQTLLSHCVLSGFELFTRFSSLSRLQRVVAYCLRFKTNTLNKPAREFGPLSVQELRQAMESLIHTTQSNEFAAELSDLQASRRVSTKSKLITLNPFLDENGIIRVGGRLRHANVDQSIKHPIVLPAKHPLTDLIIRDCHLKEMHIGAQGLLAHLRSQFWPLSGRKSIRRVLRKCIACFRVRPNNQVQLMGDLPRSRVTPNRPFFNSGVDYAGPFPIKLSRNKTGKAYLCIFVCLATKATHLEIVSDLTTTAFLNALKRFIARRGRCAKLVSDNGTNFIGANNELRGLTNMLEQERGNVKKFLADQAIQWQFIPAHSPHMGGLLEAAVKSTKTHLKRVIGNQSLTFEELGTIFAQIEAVLNSRPLCATSNDPQDYEVLTPGHFIIGEPLNSFPEPNLFDVLTNRLTRFQLLSQMRQNFWKRWSSEYLTQLQNRYKWQRPTYETIKIGTLVLLKDKDLPPLKWHMARIIETHVANDGYVRVVSVKTSKGVTKRAINQICVLPIDN
ncbi:uncharacterized protein LOC105199705 [Solenopsis invicta]|uniref:uncharacterized protein LOC105199705 n=1 Tax=Solenopsis invicta TaxID=13686 RepID=UPI000595C14E|nr:uncharacterized protein LOC105199705 [Solenopsis invicta]